MPDKKYIGYSEDKKTAEYIAIFAKTRGLKTSSMVHQAVYEYIRRKLPKNLVTLPFVLLQGIVNEVNNENIEIVINKREGE